MLNWPFLPGQAVVIDGINFGTIAATANQATKPTNAAYGAPHGNDLAGNGSPAFPFRTANKTAQNCNGGIVLLAPATYRETLTAAASLVVACGDVIFDGTLLTYFCTVLSSTQFVSTGLLTIRNYINYRESNASLRHTWYNTRVENVDNLQPSFDNNAHGGLMANVEVRNCANVIINYNSQVGIKFRNVTFSDLVRLTLNETLAGNNSAIRYETLDIIIENCNVIITSKNYLDYSCFWHVNIKFGGGGTTPTILPYTGNVANAVTSGYTAITSKAVLLAAYVSAYSVPGFQNCGVFDPLFLDKSIGDFTLSYLSPARNFNYNGLHIGARSWGVKKSLKSLAANSDFDNVGATNITVTDGSAVLSSDAVGIIEDKEYTDFGREEEIKSLRPHGVIADRNGEMFDHIVDVSTVEIAAGSSGIIEERSYLVKGASIVYNGLTITTNNRFSGISGITDFSSPGGGVVVDITERPNIHTMQVKFSSISTADADTQGYLPFAIFAKPTVNRVGNNNAGAIIRTNGFADQTEYTALSNVTHLHKWFRVVRGTSVIQAGGATGNGTYTKFQVFQVVAGATYTFNSAFVVEIFNPAVALGLFCRYVKGKITIQNNGLTS